MSPEEHRQFVALLEQKPSLPFKGIIWHHSATKDGKSHDIAAIRRYHKAFRIDGNIVTKTEWIRRHNRAEGNYFQIPWSDVGYHLLLENRDGVLRWEFGRPFTEEGAHAGNLFNQTHLGFCLVGNFDATPPDKKSWDLCLEFTRIFMSRFEFPKKNILGHREIFPILGQEGQKPCPGWAWDLDKFRHEL